MLLNGMSYMKVFNSIIIITGSIIIIQQIHTIIPYAYDPIFIDGCPIERCHSCTTTCYCVGVTTVFVQRVLMIQSNTLVLIVQIPNAHMMGLICNGCINV